MSANPKLNGDRLSFTIEQPAEENYEMIPHSSKVKDSRSKYDLLFPEIEEVLGPAPTFRPCTLVWRDVTVHTKLKDGKLKRLVNNVSGIAKPGTMTALMGPSGAGKTTLMTALAHRNPVGTIVDGDILMNGAHLGDFMHQESGYMHQDDLFVDNLTVIEHLTIMARLRMDGRTSSLARKRRVNQLLRQLSLYGSRFTLIGGLDGRKTLSGGERKRLAFATELLTDPGLLFCDEPTTGLDSSSAHQMMTLLRASAAQGKTVICTIHQPNTELMAQFDKLVLLAEGRVAFAGTATQALSFFKRNHGVPPLHQLLMTLRFYALGTMLISVADFVGVSKSTAGQIIRDISSAIAYFYDKYIFIHSGASEKFYEMAGFPRVLGAIDCTHIHIQSPSQCDAGQLNGHWLLGDSAYPNRSYLLTPLLNPRSEAERKYNEAHIWTRNTIESLGYTCPLMYNPTDYFIKVLSLTPGSESASRQAIKNVCDRFAVSDAAKELDMEIHFEFHLMDNEDSTRSMNQETHDTFKPPFFLTKLWWLIYRYLLIVIRDPRVQCVRILQKLAIALTAGMCFMGTARLTQSGIQDVQGALFIIIAENTFSPMYSVLHMFPEEFPLLNRELKAGLYSAPIYYTARMVALLPGLLIEPTLFTLVVYWIAGLRGSLYAFSFTVFLAILVLNVAIACGSFFSCAFGSMPVAIAYLVPFDYALMMTSGLFIKLSSMPKYVSWIRHLSWLMYSNEAMSILQWDGVQNITCVSDEIGMPCLSTGEEVLTTYDFASKNLWIDVLALFILYLAFHSLAVLALRHRTRRK